MKRTDRHARLMFALLRPLIGTGFAPPREPRELPGTASVAIPPSNRFGRTSKRKQRRNRGRRKAMAQR